MTNKTSKVLETLRKRSETSNPSSLGPSSKLLELKEKIERSFCDVDGWFDAGSDRERYIRYLEWVNEHWVEEHKQLCEELESLKSQMEYLEIQHAGVDW